MTYIGYIEINILTINNKNLILSEFSYLITILFVKILEMPFFKKKLFILPKFQKYQNA